MNVNVNVTVRVKRMLPNRSRFSCDGYCYCYCYCVLFQLYFSFLADHGVHPGGLILVRILILHVLVLLLQLLDHRRWQ